MMRRRDPVQGLLRLRGIREALSRAAFGRANRTLAERHVTLGERERRYHSRPVAPAELTAIELRAIRLGGMHDAEAIAGASVEVVRAREAAEEARVRWLDDERDLDAARKLDRRRRDELAQLARRAADVAMDRAVLEMRGRRQW